METPFNPLMHQLKQRRKNLKRKMLCNPFLYNCDKTTVQSYLWQHTAYIFNVLFPPKQKHSQNQFFQNYVFLDELRVSTAVAVVDIQEIIFKVCCHR